MPHICPGSPPPPPLGLNIDRCISTSDFQSDGLKIGGSGFNARLVSALSTGFASHSVSSSRCISGYWLG